MYSFADKQPNFNMTCSPGPGLIEVSQNYSDVLLLVLERLELGGELVIEALGQHHLELRRPELPDQIVVRLHNSVSVLGTSHRTTVNR